MTGADASGGRRSDRLSVVLEQLLHQAGAEVTLDSLVRHTEGRSVFLLIILLSLPFITPLPVPGFSIPFGGVVMILGWRLARHHQGGLPGRLGRIRLPLERFGRILRGSVGLLRVLEGMARPRGGAWTRGSGFFGVNCLLISWCGFLLALPLPIPFSNAFPAQGSVLLALATLERDGRVVWLGYLASAWATVYIGLSAFGGWTLLREVAAWLGFGGEG